MAVAQRVLKRKSLRSRIWQYRIAYAFIAPAVFVMLLVHLVPSAQAIYMSFLDLRQKNLLEYLRAPFIGLEHYRNIIGGLLFGTGGANIRGLSQALRNTVWFTLWVNCGTLTFSMTLALLLNRRFRGRGMARTLVFLPWVVPTFVVGLIWQFIWLQRGGLANRILVDWLGVVDSPIRWLLLENARWALIIPAIWRGIPLMTIFLLSGLQVIPTDLYEAAAIDGASPWQRFRFITLPWLKPIIVINLMFGIVFNLFGFGPYNIAVSMFNGNNLGKYADLLVPAIARQTFNNQLYGYGAAASVLMMVFAMVFVAVWYRAFREDLLAQ